MNPRELDAHARSLLPTQTYALIADAAGQGVTARRNREVFSRRSIIPRVLRDVSTIDTATALQGSAVSAPLGVAPLPRMAAVHPDGERGLAEAAADLGLVFCAATNSTIALEELVIDGAPAWFQLYPHSDPGITRDLTVRAAAAGYRAVVVTLDRPVPGLKSSEDTKTADVSAYPNLARYGEHQGAAARYDPSFTWRELTQLREDCSVPLIVKGVLDREDARLAIEHGCDGVWVSNHGGRQVDQTITSLEALEGIAVGVDGRGEVYLDGGVRTGVDVVIAIALGATSVFLGRPMACALAVDGRAGVRGALEQLRDELAHAMALTGTATLDDLTRDRVG